MRILLINSFLYHRGGDCTYTFNLGELLKSKGHDVFYWGMQHPKNYEFEYSEYFADYVDFVELNKNKNITNYIKIFKNNIYSKKNKNKLEKFIKLINPDIVHLNNIHGHLTPSIIDVIKKYEIPIIWTLHDYKLLCPNTHFLSNGEICEACKRGKYYNCFFKRCKKNSYAASFAASFEAYIHKVINFRKKINYFIAPSEFLKNKFIEYNWPNNKIIFIRNFLSLIPERITSIGKDYFLYFGGLDSWKGIFTLINAFSTSNSTKRLLLVGDGQLRDEIKKYITNRNFNKNINLVGFKRGTELTELIKNAYAIIVPSEWYENCPYSIMEAMSFGKAIIASRIGGIPELVIDNYNGILFEPKNISDLRDKIDFMEKNPKIVKKFGMNSYEIAKKEFSPDIYYEKIIKIYKQLLYKG